MSAAVRLDGLRADKHDDEDAEVRAPSTHHHDDEDADAAASADDEQMAEALERVSYGRFQQRLLLPVTGLTLLADAMELMLLPFLTLGVECEWGRSSARATAGDQSSVVSDVESSLLSTAVFAGMLIGALLSGLLSDRWGRRPTVLLLTACTGLFGLGSALASSFHSLLLCRAMVGVGVGGSPAALALFTEFLPKQQRGRYLVHYMCYFSAGAVLEVVLAWLVLNRWGWRWLLFLSALPALLLTALVWLFLPESASWLLAQGRRRAAGAVLVRAFRANHPDLAHRRSCPLHTERLGLDGEDEEEDGEGQGAEWGEHGDAGEGGPGAEAGAHAQDLIPCRCSSTPHGPIAASPPRAGPGPAPTASLRSSGGGSDTAVSSAVPAIGPSHRRRSAHTSGIAGFLDPIRLVFSPELRVLSAHLCALFFLMAFVYYGLVLMSMSFVQDQDENELHTRQCALRDDQYLQLLAANIAEFPGLFLCFLLLDRVGRRLTITYMFLATAACTVCIPALWALNTCAGTTGAAGVGGKLVGAGNAAPPDSSHCPLSPLLDWAQSILLFGARGFSLAFNQALWIYTSELYPAQVRSSGLGLTTVFARVGGAISPFIGQWLYWRSRHLAVGACVLAAVVAAALAARMPNDTKDAELLVRIRTAPRRPVTNCKRGYEAVQGCDGASVEPAARCSPSAADGANSAPRRAASASPRASGSSSPAPRASSPRARHAPDLLLGSESQTSSEEEAAADSALVALNLDVLRGDNDELEAPHSAAAAVDGGPVEVRDDPEPATTDDHDPPRNSIQADLL